jgi:alpha-L-rhamnosidase
MIHFAAARPIWPAGMERDMNRFVRFRASLPQIRNGFLRITASTLYRARINTDFVGYGPARAAHGYFRVDEWPIDRFLRRDGSHFAIDVAGYNINSYYTLDQPAFLQAEVIDAGGHVLAATGTDAFDAILPLEHVRRVERYSAARTFSEVFRLDPASTAELVACAVQPPVQLLPRRVAYPEFDVAANWRQISDGSVESFDPPELLRDWTLTCIGPDLKGFREEELEVVPSLELQKLRSVLDASPAPEGFPIALAARRYRILDVGANLSGFIRLQFRCEEPARIALVFDELLTSGDVSFNRLRCNNVIWIDAQRGDHTVETFEPYTLRYAKVICIFGSCIVESISLRRYEHPAPVVSLDSTDARLHAIFDAAVSTFRQNAVDLPTDCPSRERAAWLCDSFYIARAAHRLSGSSQLEWNFLENYLLPDRFEHLPRGMVPMNYPADHPNGKFIPNFAFWLILQLQEYLARSNDRAMINAFRERIEEIFRYFDRFKNADGLLEGLEGWIFVEWSAANEFAQDVNYPTNMLYAAALESAGRLYARADWLAEAQRLRGMIASQAFDGEFFVDNSVRVEGVLQRTSNRTEVCQYHAFHFGVASPQSHPALWRRIISRDLGDLHAANALMGYTLRLELLDRHASSQQVCDELIAMYLHMAEATGTLWEHNQPTASCCHGFASHAAVLLLKHAPLASKPAGQ